MKKLLNLFLASILAFSIVGCAKSNKDVEVKLDLPTLKEELATAGEVVMTMPMEKEFLTDSFNADFDLLEEEFLSETAMMTSSHRIYVVEVKDVKDIDSVKAWLQKAHDQNVQSFEQYLPEPYEDAKKGQIISRGKYVAYFVGKNTQAMVDLFNSKFESK